MKLIIFSLIWMLSFQSPQQDKVYVCVGGSAYAYHKTKKCTWLQNCTHRIEEVTLEEAINTYKRKPCKPCYK